MTSFQLDFEHSSQWDWGDTEWFAAFIAQIWSKKNRFPRNQEELGAIDYEEIQREFEGCKQEGRKILGRGTTLEEGWICGSILTRRIWMQLRSAREYWPPDRVPRQFKIDLAPIGIWKHIYYSFEYYRQLVARLPIAELKLMPQPVGVLGVFLGNCPHTVWVVGISDDGRIIFHDSWQRGKSRSLLSRGLNARGMEAVRMGDHTWSITKEECVDSLLFYTTPKAHYDYYASRIRGSWVWK